ncbi:hypothetical protein Tco_0875590 [Tanacetum coccineum]|uniref:Uncharacterized protein n=1 Tax=Tanacetum coccineum TaxID=301880 RepID=A0ABQ5BVI8_9ASTR
MRVPPKVVETNDLSNPVTSNSAPTTKESKVMKNDKVIALGMFRINPFKTSKEDKFVPINQARASVRTNPITVSQPRVINKKDVNSDSNGLSSTGVDITAMTRRPQPRSNTKNERVPSASKSSCIKNKEVKVEDHHRNLLLSKNKKHMSSKCNNIKLAIQNKKSEQEKPNANVSKSANQKKHKPNVKRSKKLGSKEILASPRPRKSRTCLRWLPTKRIFYICGKITTSSNTESESGTSVCDNASASNPQEPTSKGFPNSTSFLDRFTRLRRQNTCIHPVAIL